MAVPRNVHYSDLGGIETVLRDITELIEYPLAYPEVRLDAIAPRKAHSVLYCTGLLLTCMLAPNITAHSITPCLHRTLA